MIVLLGSLYLDAVDPPLPAAGGQRVIYFAKAAERRRLTRTGGVLVLAGARESTLYRMGVIGLKGRMLELFARAVAREGQSVVDAVHADGTGAAMTQYCSARLPTPDLAAAPGGRHVYAQEARPPIVLRPLAQ